MGNEEKMKKSIYIQLFDQFCISDGERSLGEEEMHSKMLLKLFSYIYTHKKKVVTTEELIDALWEGEESTNPPGALKNLVYRLRNILKEKWPEKEFILSARGSYQWNNDIDALSDTEMLKDFYQLGIKEENLELSREHLLKAIEEYRGEFLPKASRSAWVISEGTFYHSIYLSAVKELAKLLEHQEEYELLEEICNEALKRDSLNEDLHGWFIKALLYQKKVSLAEGQYKKAADLLYENLGVSPSDELKNLYQELLKKNHRVGKDIVFIGQELGQSGRTGAFFCEYGVFKEIYLLEKAKAKRVESTVCLVLITLEPLWDVERVSQEYLKIINEGMEFLHKILVEKLRIEDVVSRYSFSQYILMLSSRQEDVAGKILERIKSQFNHSYKRKPRARLVVEIESMNENEG